MPTMTTTMAKPPMTSPDQPSIARRVARSWHLWVPLLGLLVLVAPHVFFQLASTKDTTGEVYQPLRTLKFIKSHGREFHKYGPAPNFILAGPYAADMAWWWLRGDLGTLSDKFPFGFRRPMEQIGLMIVQGRAIMVALGLAAFFGLAREVALAGARPLAVFAAMVACIALNPALVLKLPVPEVDSPMFAFSAAAIAVYVRLLYRGVNRRRGFWYAAFVVLAVSSKEIALPVFVLPTLALLVVGWRRAEGPDGRRTFVRSVVVAAVTGVGLYALLDVVYAPHTWAERMRHWLFGEGLDADVWGRATGRAWLGQVLVSLLENVGLGGVVIAVAGLVAAAVARPRYGLLLALPSLGALLAATHLGYVQSRFFTPVVLCLMPLVAMGVDRLLAVVPARPAVAVVFALAGLNFWFATITWVRLLENPYRLAERYAAAHVDKDRQIVSISLSYSVDPASTRLRYLGYHVDGRSMLAWADRSVPAPDVVFVQDDTYKFLIAARTMPARERMLSADHGFDVTKWPGFDALGYHAVAHWQWSLPAWCPFGWVPIGDLTDKESLTVYRR